MSGFDPNWLALREPADMAARNPGLIDNLASAYATPSPAILDIGCGTGSTYRTLHRRLPQDTRWTLLDYDPALLEEARRRIAQDQSVSFCQFDLNQIDELPLSGIDCVTASALFDLCSESFCDRFVTRLAGQGSGLYAALNYDGSMSWSIEHPLDSAITRDFNAHQRREKGFGAALGPAASGYLEEALTSVDYTVRLAESPWIIGIGAADLQMELLAGVAAAVSEIDNLAATSIADWLAFRQKTIPQEGSSCRVGHTDLLALPPGHL